MTILNSFFKNAAFHVFLLISVFCLLVGSIGCTKKKPEVWVYTSIYKEVLSEMETDLKNTFPEFDVKWFQGGSENVAAKLNTELAAGTSKADLILTSDPFWYLELKEKGELVNYQSPKHQGIPKEFKDPDSAFAAGRIPIMVIGYNPDAVNPEDLPKSFKELTLPKYKGKISMGSPLESGTNFTAVAILSRTYGWDYFKELRANDLISQGGNSAVISRIETKEKPIGIVLLENILKAQSKGSKVKPIYPNDGVIPVVSPIAIMKKTKNIENAKKLYDWFYSTSAQTSIIKSGMHSAYPDFTAPTGAPTWKELESRRAKWNPEILSEIYKIRDQIKTKFTEIVLK